MNSRWLLAICGAALAASGCSVTRHGTLAKFPSGVIIPISVVVEEDAATVRGTNPETGERLAGTFHLTGKERTSPPGGVMAPAPAMGGGAMSPGTGPRPATSQQPSVLDMAGRLEGDLGTSLRCTLQVKKGLRLEGLGGCRMLEGEDGSLAFRIRF